MAICWGYFLQVYSGLFVKVIFCKYFRDYLLRLFVGNIFRVICWDYFLEIFSGFLLKLSVGNIFRVICWKISRVICLGYFFKKCSLLFVKVVFYKYFRGYLLRLFFSMFVYFEFRQMLSGMVLIIVKNVLRLKSMAFRLAIWLAGMLAVI